MITLLGYWKRAVIPLMIFYLIMGYTPFFMKCILPISYFDNYFNFISVLLLCFCKLFPRQAEQCRILRHWTTSAILLPYFPFPFSLPFGSCWFPFFHLEKGSHYTNQEALSLTQQTRFSWKWQPLVFRQ